jgi:hypothetical protein
VLAAAAAVLVLLIVLVVALRGDGDDSARGESPSSSAEPDATEQTTTVPETTTTTTEPSTTTTTAEGQLPAGWTPFIDPAGAYSIGLPPGWQVRRTESANRTDLVDPATGSFLRIDWISPPAGDPVADWERQASGFAARTPSYQQIGIERVSYRDYDAALWEFRHEGQHTGNLAFVTNGRGYALMLRTPESAWAGSQELFEQFKQAFRPT